MHFSPDYGNSLFLVRFIYFFINFAENVVPLMVVGFNM